MYVQAQVMWFTDLSIDFQVYVKISQDAKGECGEAVQKEGMEFFCKMEQGKNVFKRDWQSSLSAPLWCHVGSLQVSSNCITVENQRWYHKVQQT